MGLAEGQAPKSALDSMEASQERSWKISEIIQQQCGVNSVQMGATSFGSNRILDEKIYLDSLEECKKTLIRL